MVRASTLVGAIIVLLVFSLSCACGGGNETAGYVRSSTFGKAETVVMGYDAARRGAYMRLGDGGALEAICAEPPPDALTTLASNMALAASGAGTVGEAAASALDAGAKGSGPNASGSLGISNAFTQTATKLSDPTSATLFLREVLYRRCEARLWLVDASTKPTEEKKQDDFFDKVIKAYVEIVATDERAGRVQMISRLIAELPTDKRTDPQLVTLSGAAASDPTKLADLFAYAAKLLPPPSSHAESDASVKTPTSPAPSTAAAKPGPSSSTPKGEKR